MTLRNLIANPKSLKNQSCTETRLEQPLKPRVSGAGSRRHLDLCDNHAGAAQDAMSSSTSRQNRKRSRCSAELLTPTDGGSARHWNMRLNCSSGSMVPDLYKREPVKILTLSGSTLPSQGFPCIRMKSKGQACHKGSQTCRLRLHLGHMYSCWPPTIRKEDYL